MRYLISLLLLVSVAAGADFQIVYTVAVTNAPTTNGMTFTANSVTRTWTNSATGAPATSIATNATIGGSATNLWLALAANPISFGHNYRIANETSVVIRLNLNQAFAVSLAGGWGFVTASTNTVTNAFIVRVPVEVESSAQRSSMMSHLVSGLSQYSTQAFATNATALSNFLNLGADAQTVKNKVITNATVRGGSISNTPLVNIPSANITNLTGRGVYLSNTIAHTLTVTNFASPGTGASTVKIGDSTTADGDYAVVVGNGASASVDGVASVVIGQSASGTNNGVTAVGFTSIAGGLFSSAYGNASSALYDYSTAIGYSAVASNANEIAIGTPSESVRVRGTLHAAKPIFAPSLRATNVWATNGITGHGAVLTNNAFGGTNYWHGDLSVTPLLYTGAGNGDNYNLGYGTNASIYVSGPTTVANFHSIPAGRSYQRLRVRFSGAITNVIVNESLGEGTATERITTKTGGNISMTNQPAWVEFEYTGSRWEVVAKDN